jgi:hypothetical protein
MIGIIINAITWAIARPLVELFSMKRPELDYSKLSKDNEAAYKNIIDNNFSYTAS